VAEREAFKASDGGLSLMGERFIWVGESLDIYMQRLKDCVPNDKPSLWSPWMINGLQNASTKNIFLYLDLQLETRNIEIRDTPVS
jgi:hypothetical protein